MPRLRARALLLGAAALAAAPRAHAGDAVAVTWPPDAATSAPIAPDLASFSVEVPSAPLFFAVNGTPRLSFVNLMSVLRNATGDAGGRGPNIRIGGGSSDTSALLPPAAPLPDGVTYRIAPSDIATYAVVERWGGSLVIGTRFANASDTATPVAFARAVAASGIRADILYECGNEVDLYGGEGYRPANYSGADYIVDSAAFHEALRAPVSAGGAGLPPGSIQGAVFEGIAFFDSLDPYMRAYGPPAQGGSGSLGSVSLHVYTLGHCQGKTVSIWDLLNEEVIQRRIPGILPHVATARALGLPLLIGEGNSASCGGQHGVSDVFASALWAVDSLLAHAAAGVARWNFHGGGQTYYSPITYSNYSLDVPPTVHPLFLGMWATTAVTRGSAVILGNVTATFSPPAASAYISAWVLRGGSPSNDQRVVLIHKDGNATAPASVSVQPPPGSVPAGANATLVRLQAAEGGIFARFGVSYGGLSFDNSTDGTPVGSWVEEHVQPSAGGAYAFTLPVASAAFLYIPGF